jgi:hypothetical protein
MGIALLCWCQWRHWNKIVFEGANPLSMAVIRKIITYAELWRVAELF